MVNRPSRVQVSRLPLIRLRDFGRRGSQIQRFALLRREGYDVVATADGRTGLDEFARAGADIVLLRRA